MIKISIDKISSFLMFLLGVSLGTNVIYLFTIGSTHFILSEVLSVIIFVYVMVTKQLKIKQLMNVIMPEFKLFFFLIIISSIFAFFAFMNLSYMYRYVVGLISFLICCTSLIDMIVLMDFRSFFIKGCIVAIVLNILISFVQWACYYFNIPFLVLYDLFPQESFHLNVYNVSVQGLFLEPSHMNQFLGSIFILCLGFLSWEKWKYYLIFLGVIVISMMSTSGTSMVTVFGIMLFLLFNIKFKKTIKKRTLKILFFLFVTILGVLLFYMFDSRFQEFVSSITETFSIAMKGSNLVDNSNIERTNSMRVALELIPQYPFGCGWNMVHTLLQQKTSLIVATAFSEILEMTLELGIIGTIVYLSMFIRIIFCCFFDHTIGRSIAISMICVLTMQLLGDYAINPCIMCIFAIGMYEATQRKIIIK